MRRQHHPVWIQARAAVERAIEPLGFSLYSEMSAYGAFGSESASYARSDLTVELTWDGKDGWLFASYRRVKLDARGVFGEATPLDVPPPSSNSRAHTLPEGTLATEYIDNLVAALVSVAKP